jgi:hypothetical protein
LVTSSVARNGGESCSLRNHQVRRLIGVFIARFHRRGQFSPWYWFGALLSDRRAAK